MRRFLAVLSLFALTIVGVVMLAGPSSGETAAVAFGGLPDTGKVTLKTGGTNRFTYAPGPDSAVPGATQSITNSNSATCTPTTPGFISVAGKKSGRSACFGTLGFGDGPGGSPFLHLNPNTDAAQSEALVLTLAGPLADFEIATFTLDLEAVNVPSASGGSPEIVIEVRDSSDPGGAPLQTLNVDLSNANKVLSIPPNYRVPVTELAAPGDQLVVRPQGNVRFQLEGDTGVGSILGLTDITDVVDCNGGEASTGQATLQIQGGEGCTDEPIFFEFDEESNELTLLKNPSDAVFLLNVTWNDDVGYPGRITEIDYFDGSGFNPMVFCDGDSAAPVLPGDQIPGTVAIDGWCVAQRSITLDDGAQVTAETLYGVGDPRYK